MTGPNVFAEIADGLEALEHGGTWDDFIARMQKTRCRVTVIDHKGTEHGKGEREAHQGGADTRP